MNQFFAHPQDSHDLAHVGGKGMHLQKLSAWGATVADFFVLTTAVHEKYKQGGLPEEVKEKINVFISQHGTIVFRSSMTGEDQFDASFAGLFETILNVNAENWETSLSHIYDSVNSERVKEYIRQKGIKVDLKMAVVVQKQIQVEKSGVLFTRSPVEPTSAVAIDAAYGMGEGVVSGHADVDHYLLTRNGETIREIFNSGLPVLSQAEIKELIKVSVDLEEQIKVPSDIEWGYEGDKLYIFQIRPITRNFPKLESFVDTNLSESYPGSVSPFTAGFVKVAYRNVYTESAVLFGAKGERLENLKFHYNKLIASVDNHLYYNLEHYYAILRALPGGEKNIDDWHKMIGGHPDNMRVPYHATTLSKKETLSAIINVLKLAFKKDKIFEQFLIDLEVIKNNIESDFPKLKNSQEAIHFMNKQIERPLGFGLTVVNDVFVMVGMGILRKRLKKKGIEEESLIELLKTSHTLDSLKPLHVLNDIVKTLPAEFLKEFSLCKLESGITPYFPVFDHLRKKGWEKEVKIIEGFLYEYGDRSFEELKLESLPLKNNPPLLYELMNWSKTNEVSMSPEAKNQPEIPLSKFDNKILKFTKECIALREATRLWRGKFYHILRQNMMTLVKLLMKEDSSWKEFKLLDFFSVTHLEWLDYAEGRLKKDVIQSNMHKRKEWQMSKRLYPEIIQWSADESLPLFEESSELLKQDLKGQGVSVGEIEGHALVLEHPQEAFHTDLKDFILITKNTDPAWVYIMSRSKGLISEKGSLLSHTAIIGRELGIPTVVGLAHATKYFKTGDRIRMNGQTGEVIKL